ncbi:ATP adenylyltransferase-domain-containing protein [Aspergillus crustosus]
MTTQFSYSSILSTFDDLVKREIIYYAPRTTVKVEDDGFLLEFHTSPSLSKKPQGGYPVSGHEDPNAKKPELFGPGSDIANDDPSVIIATIHETHLLVINKFSMFRPQLLLLTSDSYRRQHEPLGLEDFAAACTVLGALDWKPFVIFNGGRAAGASRQHKHLQVLPRPPKLFPDSQDARKAVPYRYCLRYLHGIELQRPEGYAKLSGVYTELLAEAKESLGDNIPDDGYVPHNVALTREWIIVIPRRNVEVEGVTANTAGMLGSVWLTSEEQMSEWKEVGPKKILAGLGVPA